MTEKHETFADLLTERLTTAKKTAQDLADSLDLPVAFVEGLLDGSVPPPRSSRSDIYDRMTRCVRAGRRELAAAADAQRAGEPSGTPSAKVAALLLDMCETETAAVLKERANKERLADATQRLLDLVQASVARALSDTVGIRAVARRRGVAYADQRERILRFLDTTAGTVTTDQLAEFVVPRLSHWDVDMESGVLRLVMRGQEAANDQRRRPPTRRAV